MPSDNSDGSTRTALVLYPASENYTTSALLQAFKIILPSWTVHTEKQAGVEYDLQYCDYDMIVWDDAERPTALTNSYILRKVWPN